jgi:transposase
LNLIISRSESQNIKFKFYILINKNQIIK